MQPADMARTSGRSAMQWTALDGDAALKTSHWLKLRRRKRQRIKSRKDANRLTTASQQGLVKIRPIPLPSNPGAPDKRRDLRQSRGPALTKCQQPKVTSPWLPEKFRFSRHHK